MWHRLVLVLASQHVASAVAGRIILARAPQSCPLIQAPDCATLEGLDDADNDPPLPGVTEDLTARDLPALDDSEFDLDGILKRNGWSHVPATLEELERRHGRGEVPEELAKVVLQIEARLLGASGNKETYEFCKGDNKMSYVAGRYPTAGKVYDNLDWSKCDNFAFDAVASENGKRKYIAEHILERQMLKHFLDSEFMAFDAIELGKEPKYSKKPNPVWAQEDPTIRPAKEADDSYCKYIGRYWDSGKNEQKNIDNKKAWDWVALGFPNNDM